MDQLSRPYQVILLAVIGLGAAWFLVLRPKGSGDVAPLPTPTTAVTTASAGGRTAPGAAGLGRAVDKAKGAVATSSTAAGTTSVAAAAASAVDLPAKRALQPAATTPAARPATVARPATAAKAAGKPGALTTTPGAPAPTARPAPAAPAAPADPAQPVLDALARGEVAVVLFSDPAAADDRDVRGALAHVDRHDGRVVVRSVAIGDVARWGSITLGAQVTQSPTVLVIGPDHTATPIVGYTDARAIDQAVGDAGGARFVARTLKGYRAKAANICQAVTQDALTGGLSAGSSGSAAQAADMIGAAALSLRDSRDDAARLRPGRRYRAFDRALLLDLSTGVAALDSFARDLRGTTGVAAGLTALKARVAGPDARLHAAAERAHVAC